MLSARIELQGDEIYCTDGGGGTAVRRLTRLEEWAREYDITVGSRAIAEQLAAADPSNASWQRHLFVSHAKLGSVLEQ